MLIRGLGTRVVEHGFPLPGVKAFVLAPLIRVPGPLNKFLNLIVLPKVHIVYLADVFIEQHARREFETTRVAHPVHG